MTTPNWQHHSRKQPKYKAKPRMVQAARKRTKMLIKKLTSHIKDMTDHYYYYEAMLGTGKKIHLFARDDIEAAYRATHIAKWHWKTTLTDIYLDKHHHYNEERISKQLQHDS